jgi:hypothetical protein
VGEVLFITSSWHIIYVPWKDKNKSVEWNRAKYLADPEADKARQKQSRIRRRWKVINHYGGKCACCGEDRYEFLAMDHINGGGTQHRKNEKIVNIDRWLIKNEFPDGFRVLCHNCNQAYGSYGYCPHNTESGVAVCIPVLDTGGAGFDSPDSDGG